MKTSPYIRLHHIERGTRQSALCVAALLVLLLSMLVAPDAYGFIANTVGDYGNVTVMEVDGGYDALNPDGTPNTGPRQEIAREFYRTHRDEYDFLVIFTNFDFPMPEAEARAFYSHVRNDVQGIGLELFDNSGLYGSNRKLQGTIDMGNEADLSTVPVEPGFEQTLDTLGHEILHRWGAHVRFQNASGGISGALLGKDGSHWSYLLDSGGSVLYGNGWQDNGDGTFTSVAANKYLSPLDLYLMGIYEKAEVPPMLLIESPGTDPAWMPGVGDTVHGTAQYVTIDDIIAAEGERVPGPTGAQKAFRTAFIYATRPGTFTGEGLRGIEEIRNGWVTRFSILTDGEAITEVALAPIEDLPSNPGVIVPPVTPRTLPPDIEDGVAWLVGNQNPDGSWLDMSQTAERDTAESVLALGPFDLAEQSFVKGVAWLGTLESGNLDYLARKTASLVSSGEDVSALIGEVVSRQNADGGWGTGRGYLSSATDTSLALRTLAEAGYTDPDVISRTIDYLTSEASPDGGWGNVQTTTNVLVAFNRYRDDYPLDDMITGATGWLLQRQNADGGFGNSPSTVYDTAMSVMALRELGASTDITNGGLNYILGLQSGDGSWFGSAYQTAIAVNAVWKATMDPDLSIQTGDISFIPTTVTGLPANITLRADVWNLGRSDVAQATVALYEGDPALGRKLGEQTLSFPGMAATTVTFAVTMTDANANIFYVTADPDGLVKESNERNNSAYKNITVSSTYDFEITDIAASEDVVNTTDEVTMTAVIENNGTMDAYTVPVGYFLETPEGTVRIATDTVTIPAGGSVTSEATWKASIAGENLPLSVVADPDNSFEELSEDNNSASSAITVNELSGVNLTVSHEDFVFTPAVAEEGSTVSISAVVRNDGSEAAGNVTVNTYVGVPDVDGELLGSVVIPSLSAGESRTVVVDWSGIPVSGEKVIYVSADPENMIEEITEEDNGAFTTLRILGLPDLVVSDSSIEFSPKSPKEGDVVSITITVQNGGEQNSSVVPVRFYDGEELIGELQTPEIAGGTSESASLAFDTAGRPGEHRISALVDPEDVVRERSEDNNTATRTLGVQDSAFWLTEKYISPNGDGVQDETRFFFSLELPRTVEIAVADEEGLTVRTFSGGELENAEGGNVLWDGLDDMGRVVADGKYQMAVVDTEDGSTLGSLPVVVDNNRSPFADAIGTKYLMDNGLACEFPNYDNYDWDWLPDESGLVFNTGNYTTYPLSLYRTAPDGDDIYRLIPEDWTLDNPVVSYSIYQHYISPNGDRIVFTLFKQDRQTKITDFEIWMVDIDGSNLTLLKRSEDLNKLYLDWQNKYLHVQWSADGKYIAFAGWLELRVINIDTLEERLLERMDTAYSFILDNAIDDSDYWKGERMFFKWSPGSDSIAYKTLQRCENNEFCEQTLADVRIADLTGNKTIVHSAYYSSFPKVEWLGENLLFLVRDLSASPLSDLYLYDTLSGNTLFVRNGINEYSYRIIPSPDNKFIVIYDDTYEHDDDLEIYDMKGNLVANPVTTFQKNGAECYRCKAYISHNPIWSPSEDKFYFTETIQYEYVQGCNNPCPYNSTSLVSVDMETKEENRVELTRKISAYEGELYGLLSDDVSVVGMDRRDILVINSETGDVSLVANGHGISPPERMVSPLGNYINYYNYKADSCQDKLWTVSSLLNLTVDVMPFKESSFITIKGTAVDLNFGGYKLEYADIKTPNNWNLIAPPSDIPVINAELATWVPPYEGTFYVKLTAWDKAGNVEWERKRVSWGSSASITGLYKSLDIFSPNGDGVKDTVELNYRALEPVHLEFNIFDGEGGHVRTFYTDHAVPETGFISWSGKDESGQPVPDGSYTIEVMSYKFHVEVDNTPPDANLSLGEVIQNPDTHVYYSELFGHAYDENLKGWVIESGEGENPDRWYELESGEDQLAERDEYGDLVQPVTDTFIRIFADEGLAGLAGRKLLLTAEDNAGNKSSYATGVIDEIFVIRSWDGIEIDSQGTNDEVFYLNSLLPTSGEHRAEVLSTIRQPMSSMNVQFWNAETGKWTDAYPELIDPPLSAIIIWDSESQTFDAVRVMAVDIYGEEHYSNILVFESAFQLSPCPDGMFISINNYLFEELVDLRVKLKEAGSGTWTDYEVFTGSDVPVGVDVISTIGIESSEFILKLVGTGTTGTVYESREYDYPNPLCQEPEDDKTVLYPELNFEVKHINADCGQISGSASLTATIDSRVFGATDEILSYYLEKPEGPELLHQFDLASDPLKLLTLDTTGMDEGKYTVKAVLAYVDVDGVSRMVSASELLYVDRELPSAEINYPIASQKTCSTSDTVYDMYFIPVEGTVGDNVGIGEYELLYGYGEDPSGWSPSLTKTARGTEPIQGSTPISGLLGNWDVTNLTSDVWSLKLKAVDKAGNAACSTVSVSVNKAVEIINIVRDKDKFSPNSDGYLDTVQVSYKISEYASMDVKVHELITETDGSLHINPASVRTIISGQQHIDGTESVTWDGKNDAGLTVPDGKYAIAIYATDSCDNTSMEWTPVEVDNTPPTAVITYPGLFGLLDKNVVEITGTVDDLNFRDYKLMAGEGETPDAWISISSGNSPVDNEVIGTWNTYGLEGRWTVRLEATDKLGNRNETNVVVDLETRATLIKMLDASPTIFSPNDDGNLDTVDISYEITDTSDINLEIFNGSGSRVRSYTNTAMPVGVHTFTWNGRDGPGEIVPSGSYSIKLTAALSSNGLVTQSEAVSVAVDTVSPTIEITLPEADSYISTDIPVTGTISDDNIVEYSVSYSDGSGAVILDEGDRNRTDHVFRQLGGLSDGNYTLKAYARDRGENVSDVDITFTIDNTKPEVTLDAPTDGEYYGSGKNTINITGNITEENLESFSLRYGPGESPSLWTELTGGSSLPSGAQLYSWSVGKDGSVADGIYTLSLYAVDKAGLESELKVTVIVDNTAPEVSISSPIGGAYIKEATDIVGTAADANLDKYTLEFSEGECASAYKWVPMKTNSISVNNGLIETWQTLPPDGNYCIRLSAEDKLSNKSETMVAVTVDTHPPTEPVLSGEVKNQSDVHLRWSRNAEPDIAGYHVYRDGHKLSSEPVTDVSYLDQGLDEGIYAYTVKAVDLAGWESPVSNEVRLTIDLNGPDVNIRVPSDGATISDVVNIKGTAYSESDFRQYRVYVGQGLNPSSWELLRSSPLSTTYDTLARWDTIGYAEGSYSIKLEAEDLYGNVSEHRITVTIDNTPPSPPTLDALSYDNPNVLATWQSNPEPDMHGYLLYRNGRLANFAGTVVIDVKPYLINETTYLDESPSDGSYKYYLIAVDKAGNMSDQSNVEEITIDNSAPHAVIVEPADGAEFEQKTAIRAASADNDIAEVRFQYKTAQATTWIDLGEPVTQYPFTTSIDPSVLGISYGDYHLRAVATDLGGKSDQSPEFITITYTDLTAPDAPAGLTGMINGGEASLTWAASSESDLDGYNVYRTFGGSTIKVNSPLVQDMSYTNDGLADGDYLYHITAVDIYGNESEASSTFTARVYAPVLFPVPQLTQEPTIEVSGGNASSGSQVEIFFDTGSGDELQGTTTADAQGNFTFTAELQMGSNKLSARATDAAGNVSRRSNIVSVVYDSPPSSPTGLAAVVDGFDVNLSWDNNTEPDLAGYNLYRDGEKLGSSSSSVKSGQAVASMFQFPYFPQLGFDADYSTFWQSPPSFGGMFMPVMFGINLDSSQPITQVTVHWRDPMSSGSAFILQLYENGVLMRNVDVFNNLNPSNTFVFDPPVTTDMLRLQIIDATGMGFEKYVAITEVDLSRKGGLITTNSYADAGLEDGTYVYEVTAVDQNGLESPPSNPVETIVGDVEPPAPPTNLAAVPDGSNVLLSWAENLEADLAGYNVYGQLSDDWVKLNPSILAAPSYLDADLPNGLYAYRVTAVDVKGNESLPSSVAEATVDISSPDAPINLTAAAWAEGKTIDLTWEYAGETPVWYNVYRSAVSGGPYSRLNSTPLNTALYTDTGLVNNTAYFYVVTAIDELGNESAYSNEAVGIPQDTIAPPEPALFFPALPGQPALVYESKTFIAGTSEPDSEVELFRDGTSLGTAPASAEMTIESRSFGSMTYDLTTSPDGETVAYTYNGYIWVEGMKSGATRQVAEGEEPVWSPDGKFIAYSFINENQNERIGIYHLDSGVSSTLTEDIGVVEHSPSWLREGYRIAFESNRDGSMSIWVADLVTGELVRLIPVDGASGIMPSPDGSKVAYFMSSELYVSDVQSGTTVLVDSLTDGASLDWSPDSAKIAFASYAGVTSDIYVYDMADQTKTRLVGQNYQEFLPQWSPDERNIAFIRQEASGYQSVYMIPVDGSGEETDVHVNLLNISSIDWKSSGEIEYQAQSTLHIARPSGYFRFEDIDLDIGENVFSSIAEDSSGNQSPISEEISVVLDSVLMPDVATSAGDIYVYPPYPVEGDDVVANIVVRNSSQVDVDGIDVDVYMRGPSGGLETLKSETIPHIASESAELITVEWNSEGKTGLNALIVVLDPRDRITEKMESNNIAYREIQVISSEGITLETSSFGSVNANEELPITISIRNSGPAKTVSLSVQIEDENGLMVEFLGTEDIPMPYASGKDVKKYWFAGDTYAGKYKVHSVLMDSAGLIDENMVHFTVEPDINVEMSLNTDKVSYGAREDVTIGVDLYSKGVNYVIPEMEAIITITDQNGEILFAETRTFSYVVPASKSSVSAIWNTGIFSPGDYNASVEVHIEGQDALTESKTFTVRPYLSLSGTIVFAPSVVNVGNAVNAAYEIRNDGNFELVGLPVRILVVEAASQSIVDEIRLEEDLTVNGLATGQFALSTKGYELAEHKVIMNYAYEEQSGFLASGTFIVKDMTPSSVTVTSPVNGETYDSTIGLDVVAMDNASGIDIVEYRIDEGGWMILPASDVSSGRYHSSIEPDNVTEGVHVLSFRAQDRAGNISKAARITIEVQNRADFSLSFTPEAIRIKQGEKAVFTGHVEPIGSFGEEISLTVTGLPHGTTLSLDPGVLVPPGTVALEIFTNEGTEAGTHQVKVTAEGDGITHEADLTLDIAAFTVEADKTVSELMQLENDTFDISFNSVNDYEGTVDLSIGDVPYGVRAAIDTAITEVPGGARVDVQTSKYVVPGRYVITLTADDGLVEHKINVTLNIQANPEISVSIITTEGPGPNNEAWVRVFNSNLEPVLELVAFDTKYGTSAATADIDGDGHDEIIVAQGPDPKNDAILRAFSRDGYPIAEQKAFDAKYGLTLSSGDLDGDWKDEIIVGMGPDPKNPAEIKMLKYNGTDFDEIMVHNAYPGEKYGVNVAVGDIDGDHVPEIITAPGPGPKNPALIKVWKYGAGQDLSEVSSFTAFEGHYGANVSLGDLDGDGVSEIIVGDGPDPKNASVVRAFRADGTPVLELYPYDESYGYGVNVACVDVDGDGLNEIITGLGPDPQNPAWFKMFGADGSELTSFLAYPEDTKYGVRVFSGRTGEGLHRGP